MTCSSSGTPAPVSAEAKHTGTRWPSRSACSNGSCSCSGEISSPCSRYSAMSLLVELDHLVDDLGVRGLDRGEVGGAPVRLEEAVDHAIAAAGGEVERQAFGAEALAQLREHVGAVRVRLSILLTMTSRHSSRSRANSMRRCVRLSTPLAALTTTATASTASSTDSVRPRKSG